MKRILLLLTLIAFLALSAWLDPAREAPAFTPPQAARAATMSGDE